MLTQAPTRWVKLVGGGVQPKLRQAQTFSMHLTTTSM
jgi:hypothetical protein